MSTPSVCVEETLDRIAPGDHVLLHSACAELQTLVEGLVAGIRARRPNLRDLTLVALTYRSAGAAAPPYADMDLLKDGLLRLKSFFPVAALKQAAREGLVDYVPVSFANLPGLIRAGIFRPDVALMQVSRRTNKVIVHSAPPPRWLPLCWKRTSASSLK